MAFDVVTYILAKKHTDKAIAALGHVFEFKGTVPTYDDLPTTGNKVGDVWLVEESGIEYVWVNPGRWEALGGTGAEDSRYIGLIEGDGTRTTFTLNHQLGTRDFSVTVYNATTFEDVICDVVRTDLNNVQIGFLSAPAVNEDYVVICLMSKGPKGEKGEKGEQGEPGRDGAIQYTAGTGIEITDNNVINNTQTSAEWGNIEGNIADQTDLSEALGTAETKATWGNINGDITDQTDLSEALETAETKSTWGNIDGDIEDQEDLSEALGTAETKATWGNIDGSLSNQTDLNSALETKATLVNGRIPIQQMPEFVVADVVEVETYEDLPETGETNTLYHVILTDSTYRWVGNHYLLISQQSNFYSLLIDTNIATMGALKAAVDSVNAGGDHVFFDLHQLVNEGYVCTVHFWDETVSGTVHHYCEINDILNDRLYGIKQEWTSEQLVSAYCSVQGRMYDIKKVSLNGTALENDRGFVDIPKATESALGVVRTQSSSYGIGVNVDGKLYIVGASDSEIASKSTSTKAITPSKIDKLIMEGLGKNGLNWADAYKASARTTIGAGEPVEIEVF